MKSRYLHALSIPALALLSAICARAPAEAEPLKLDDVFELEYASDPQISPDGSRVVYVRNSMDKMTDQRRSRLWIVNSDGTGHRPATDGNADQVQPRWSPDGSRLAFIAVNDGSAQIGLVWLDSGRTAVLTQLDEPPSGLSWSPDGTRLAFSMVVPAPDEPFVELPEPPEGATWARPPRVVTDLYYRLDGEGYRTRGYHQLFVLPAEGGTPRQVTSGSFNHAGGLASESMESAAWTPDGDSLVFVAMRRENWFLDPLDTEIYELSLSDGTITALTDRRGPDTSPTVSPDGRLVAYLGFDDRYQTYQLTRLYLFDRVSGESRCLTSSFDRSVWTPVWSPDGSGLYFIYDEHGNTKIAFVSLTGELRTVAGDIGNSSIGRPYEAFGERCFSVAGNGRIAHNLTDPMHPSDVAVTHPGRFGPRKLTALNLDLLAHRELGEVEEIWYSSSYDGRKIQGWIVRPPGFNPSQRYPLVLEIHGGPVANYGDRFSAEMQLYAAAGYVVLYANPRGSTGYGEEFGNLIDRKYPGNDYDDLMSGVDAVIARGYVDQERLYVTGGSGGGILSAWIVGKTNRFRAAVVAKPMINFMSAELTTDFPGFFSKYWYDGYPWDQPERYLARSPLSLVGNVSTPTMLLTGDADFRTPINESEQFFAALKLRQVDTALVRIPGASHHIARRPSQLIAKVAYILKWFEMHPGSGDR
ncbi:MAG: S9 family peptidase [Acidobacteria bacterium]|nr:S9 family peptidase [Acidobacteriota bacterium]